MKTNLIYVFITAVVIVQSSFGDDAVHEYKRENDESIKKCSYGFALYEITTSQSSKIICASISPTRLPWDRAKVYCNLQFAQLTQRIYFKTALRIDLLLEGIDTLWIGIRRRSDFFVTENPSKLFREDDSFSPEHWGYHWSDNEPGQDDCVALNVTSGSLLTRDCSDSLPFVCNDDARGLDFNPQGFGCSEGWILSLSLSSSDGSCISLHEANTFDKAEGVCKNFDGQLASLEEYKILHSINPLPFLEAGKFWIKKQSNEVCQIVEISMGYFSKTFPKNCTHNYYFICVKEYPKQRIKVHLSPSALLPISSSSDDTINLLTCNVETEHLKLDGENDLLYQWYKDDLPINSNAYVIRLSFTVSGLKRDPYESDIASRQGYYHCEVQLQGSPQKYLSAKTKFFYSDIATFEVEIFGFKPTNALDYSHEEFFEYMGDFDEVLMSNVFEKMQVRYPKLEWDFKSKRTLNGTTVMKILVYIYQTGVADFDHRIACEDLKEAFQEQQSVPVFTEKISVKMNCEDYPMTNGYVQAIKSLKVIEEKLNDIETNQEFILEKLQELEDARMFHTPPTTNKLDFDVTTFLKAVEDLKRLEDSIIESTFPDRERNELEDRVHSPTRERIFSLSKVAKQFGSFPGLRQSQSNELNKKKHREYIYSSGGERQLAMRGRTEHEKDL